MNTKTRTIIDRGLKFILILTAMVCSAASCGTQKIVGSGTHCAFADPEFTTSLGICNLAAEYYVVNHAWPLSKVQLEEQNKKLLAQVGQPSPDEVNEMANFLDRFTLLEMTRKGDNLLLHYRFVIAKKTTDQTAVLKPGLTVDEILQSATAGSK